jgi:hypothetical protein
MMETVNEGERVVKRRVGSTCSGLGLDLALALATAISTKTSSPLGRTWYEPRNGGSRIIDSRIRLWTFFGSSLLSEPAESMYMFSAFVRATA